jgi:hypothetical protein
MSEERFSVYRPFRVGWLTVVSIATFELAVAEARRGCRYKKRNDYPTDDPMVRIDRQIRRDTDSGWHNWHSWHVRDETQELHYDLPTARTTAAWDEYAYDDALMGNPA